jgi:pilus assembly protein CpaE
LTVHSSGLRVLANAVDAVQNRYLTTEAVRRLAILARVAIRYTVLALDNRLSEVEVEAMRLSDAIVVVIRPDVPGVRRARWALAEAVTQGVPRNRFRVVVNRYGQSGQLPLAQIESALGFKARHLIPDDPGSVNRAANEGQLLRAGLWQRRIHRRFAALAGVLNGRNA